MLEINRPHVPDHATADFIYKAYLLLRNAPPTFDRWARQGAFENIAACSESWRVVGISEAALRQIASTGTSVDLQRGHWFAREHRYDALFGVKEPMDKDSLIKFFFEHDTTVVITKAQNNARGDHTTWGRIFAVPEGMFTTKGYGFSVRKRTEIPWVLAKVTEIDQQ